MLVPAVFVRPPSRRWLAVQRGERRVLGWGHRNLTIWTMGMDHVRTVRLGCVREEGGRIELGRRRVPLLFTFLTMSVVVWGRDRCDVELGVVGWCLTRLWCGWGGELPIETGCIAHWSGHVGGHGRGRRGRRHALCDRDALLLWRVDGVDVGACATSIKVRKEGKEEDGAGVA